VTTPARQNLAELFRQQGPQYRHQHALPIAHLRVMRAIESCRTAILGGHLEQCSTCAHQRIAYNSCRNRHCPQCQTMDQLEWLQARQQELLPIPYFHLVFTVPAPIAALALANPRPLFAILFRTSAAALLTIAQDPKHLGATPGFFSILHTWGQNLLFHPHVHCVVTGGGLSPDQQRWIASPPHFFLSVRVLSRLFRCLFVEALQAAYDAGELALPGALAPLQDPSDWEAYLEPVRRQDWVVYAQPPFGGPEQVLAYLGRYTHRVALAPQRILAWNEHSVTFRYKDYRSAEPQRQRAMTVSGDEFIRRFLLHVLPGGFQRIRYYGLWTNRYRAAHLQRCRALLAGGERSELLPSPDQLQTLAQTIVQTAARCPCCQHGVMVPIGLIAAARWAVPAPLDTS